MMKRNIFSIVLLLASAVLCTSCLDSDNEYVYDDDAAITAFTLGNINQTFFCKTKDGLRDSSYVKSVDFSSVKMTIDHLGGRIFNADSLPLGCDITKVLATASTRNSGMVGIKNVDSDTTRVFSSTDSIDYTKERELIVYSNSTRSSHRYKVTLNVHKEDGDKFVWTKLSNNTAEVGISALKGMRMVALPNNQLVLAGTDGTATRLYTSADGSNWNQTTPAALDADAYQNLITDGEKALFISGGYLYTTTDGKSWTWTATTQKQLVAATTHHLFAYDAEGALNHSTDNGSTWTKEDIDANDAAYLPQQNVSSAALALTTNSDSYRLIMQGSRDVTTHSTDTANVVWAKVIDPNDNTQPWICYYGADSQAKYRLPRLAHLQMANSALGLVAFGGKGLGACKKEAHKIFWNSTDKGLTWHEDTVVTVPTDFASSDDALAFTIDANNYVWLVCGNSAQVWRGRLNKLGWATRQDIFEWRDDNNK